MGVLVRIFVSFQRQELSVSEILHQRVCCQDGENKEIKY